MITKKTPKQREAMKEYHRLQRVVRKWNRENKTKLPKPLKPGAYKPYTPRKRITKKEA